MVKLLIPIELNTRCNLERLIIVLVKGFH